MCARWARAIQHPAGHLIDSAPRGLSLRARMRRKLAAIRTPGRVLTYSLRRIWSARNPDPTMTTPSASLRFSAAAVPLSRSLKLLPRRPGTHFYDLPQLSLPRFGFEPSQRRRLGPVHLASNTRQVMNRHANADASHCHAEIGRYAPIRCESPRAPLALGNSPDPSSLGHAP